MPSPRHRACVALAILCLAAAAVGGCKRRLAVPEGDVAASLDLPTIDDTTFDPGVLRGKPTLVVFASPTCPHCNATLPVAERAATAENANLVAVYLVGNAQHARGVTSHAQFDAPVLLDPGGVLRKRYDIRAVPYLLVLDAKGHATTALRGEQTETALRDALASAR